MTLTPEAKERIKEMMQHCYAFVLQQMPELFLKGEPTQSFDLELEAPADLLYKECKLRTMDTGKVKLVLTFFAPERSSQLILPFGRPKPAAKPEPEAATTVPKCSHLGGHVDDQCQEGTLPPEPDPED